MATTRAMAQSTSLAAGSAVIAFTGTTGVDSVSVTSLSATTGLAVGQEITGVGIVAGTTITAVDAGAATLTLSQAAKFASTTPVQAHPLGAKGVVPAAPARNRSRTALTPAGWKGIEPRSWLYKFDDPRRLRRYRAAVAAVQSQRPLRDSGVPNTGRTVLMFGDSMAMGNEPVIPHWTISPCHAAFGMLNAASFGGLFRSAAFTGAWAPSLMESAHVGDDRFTAGAGWVANNNFPGLPAAMSNAVNGADLILTDPLAWDRANIVYRSQAAGHQWTYQIGAEAPVTVTQTGTDRMVSLPITAAMRQVQPLKINRVGGTMNLAYVDFHDSTRLQMRAVNLCSGGGAIAGAGGLVNWTLSGMQSPTNLKALFDPALVILHYGYEIAGQRASPTVPAATMVADWMTAMNTYITAWKALGVDVLVMSMHPWDDTNLYKDQATVAQAREAFYAVCDANDVPGLDNFARWGTWTEAVATGFLQHYARPLPAGGHDLGAALAQALGCV